MHENTSAFRLGDIRGLYPEEINERFVDQFAQAFVGHFSLKGKIATGRDMRASSESLHLALNDALASIGIQVVDIGLCPTELGYFASATPDINAAIVITASHNPDDYNGMKCVLGNGQAITEDTGLNAIKSLMVNGYRHSRSKGSIGRVDFHTLYLEFLREYFPPEELRVGKVALNGLNGTAATMAESIATEFELPVTWFRKTPGPMPSQGADPTNPLLAAEMKTFMASDEFTLGVAWDGDCDRCVCFDDRGLLIPTYYLIGLFVENFLKQQPGGAIVFDTKLRLNTLEMINRYGGVPVPSATGHAYMKQKMHAHQAVYGGELSSHHYFGDFFGCDSGMFAWLTVLKLLGQRGESINSLISERKEAVCCTPEISLDLSDVDAAFNAVASRYKDLAVSVDYFDGLGFEMPGQWRFSLRQSKTEPLVRVNFEALGSPDTLLNEGRKVLNMLEPYKQDERNWLEQFYIQ
jgi:phosphomannomutase